MTNQKSSPTVWQWWKENSSRQGLLSTSKRLIAALWTFAQESTPARKRARYGDAEYDWERRVDTTSATVHWHDRLLGELHSPYQPTEPALFEELMQALPIDFSEYTFIDIGSGKGRTLLMAADHSFRRAIGVELLPSLHEVALQNIIKYRDASQGARVLESVCMDASKYVFPPEPTVLYLFNPLPEEGLRKVLKNFESSLRENPRNAYVLYHNPLLSHIVDEHNFFQKIGGTHQYAVYSSVNTPPQGLSS